MRPEMRSRLEVVLKDLIRRVEAKQAVSQTIAELRRLWELTCQQGKDDATASSGRQALDYGACAATMMLEGREMTRRERLEGRMERREDWAARAAARSNARFAAASAIADHIPMGQPILVGHHSERHARRDAERIGSNMSRGCEEAQLSEHHAARADGIQRQLDRSIFSDDADAIERLEEKAADLDWQANASNKINAAWRKTKGQPMEARIAALVSAGMVSEKTAKAIASTMAVCPWMDKPLSTTGLRAEARRCRQRVEEIKRLQAKTAKAEVAPNGVLLTVADGFCNVTFAEKPEREVLDALKAAGFRWGGGSWGGYLDRLPECVRELTEVTK